MRVVLAIVLFVLMVNIGGCASTNDPREVVEGNETIMIIKEGLVSFYPLDGNGTDMIGGYDGELVGTTPTADRFGRPGKALFFDGVADEVVIAKPPPMNREGTTVALWVKFESGGDKVEWEDLVDGKFSHPVLSQDDGNGIRIFLISLWKGKFRSNGQGSGWSIVFPDWQGEEEADLTQWHHMAMVRGGEHRLFINGEQVQAHPDVFNVCQCQPWLIGATRAWGDQSPHLHGAVDDIRVYERALGADEIRALWKDDQ